MIFFFVNWILSAFVWFGIAFLFNFSILGWILGLILSYLYKEFIGPMIIIAIGDNTINRNNK